MQVEERLARQRLAVEVRLKRAELALARRQLRHAEAQLELERQAPRQSVLSFFFSPTGVVLVGATLGLIGTAFSKYWDYSATKLQQETSVILKASDVSQTMDPDQQKKQRSRNLLWFAEANYITLPKDKLLQIRADAMLPPGVKVGTPVIQSSSIVPTTPQHYDFRILNQKPVDPAGISIDVFSCPAEGPTFDAASRFSTEVARRADARSAVGPSLVGLVRFPTGQGWRNENQIWFDPNEEAFARSIQAEAEALTPQRFRLVRNSEGTTARYISVYFCP